MSILTTQCPNCTSPKMPMRVQAFHKVDQQTVYAFVVCPTCQRPAAVVLKSSINPNCTADWFLMSEARGDIDVLTKSRWDISETLPKIAEKGAPEHTPPDIARLFRQAASAQNRQEFEAAGFLFGKTLEASIKMLSPDATGSLAQRINVLAAQGILPPDVEGWAHEIRIVRNDAVHEIAEPSADDVQAIAEFTEAFLLFVFTMRRKYEQRLSKKKG